jgi:DNA-binding NarL/FixJ family response regulator
MPCPSVESVRLLIVDDHAEVRKALRRLLTVEDFDVCAEAADGLEAIQATRLFKPDVILMDLFMPHMTGLQAAEEIRKEFPATPIMLVTSTDASIEQAARNVGIRGTVSKMATQEIVPCIRAMLRGDEFHRLGDNPRAEPAC